MTSVELEVWQLITLLGTFCGVIFTFGKILLSQIDRRLELQFQQQKEMGERRDREMLDLEAEIRNLRLSLPNEYVRREDWIRFSATIDAKLDTLNGKFDGIREKIYER